MSIAMVHDDTTTYCPIATQEFFVRFWLPAAEHLGLTWVPQFETGRDVAPDERMAVLDELERLYRWASAGSSEAHAHMQDRLRGLLDALRSLPADATVFIG